MTMAARLKRQQREKSKEKLKIQENALKMQIEVSRRTFSLLLQENLIILH
jgi:hypothetical protein